MESVVVGTWNMGGGEGPDGPTRQQCEQLLTLMKKSKVSVLLGQEVQKEENITFLKELGYLVYRARPESVVAWLPDLWTCVAKHDRVLNPRNPYHRKDNPKDIFIHMAHVILVNDEGVSMDAGSYHTPSSVQEKNPPPNRIKALHESMDVLSDLNADSKCRCTLFGGDDNVDEEQGAYGPWGFMEFKATGLRQLRAPRNTLGHRKVDDFRVRGLKPIGEGAVLHGPTHHNAHIRKLLLPN